MATSIPSLPATAVQDALTPTSATTAPSTRATKEALDLKADASGATGAAIVSKIDIELGGNAWRGAGGPGGGSQDSLSPGSATVPPSVDAVVAGLAGKAASSHAHTASAITDFTEASQDVVGAMVAAAGGSYDDGAGTISLPSGGGGADTLLTGYTIGANAAVGAGDTIVQAFGKVQAQINAKADANGAATISGNVAITAAAHANRTTNVSAVSASTFTAATAGAADGAIFSFVQVGAGALTITGDVQLSPGVASATTNGQGSVLDGIYVASLNKLLLTNRTAASGGGGTAPVQDLALKTASGAADADETLATLSIPARAAGDRTRIIAFFNIGNGGVNNVDFKIVWGAEIVDFLQFATPSQHMTVAVDFTVLHRSTTEHITKPWVARLNERVNGSSGVMTMNTSAATNLSFVVQRKVDTNRTAQLLGCRAEF